LRSYVTDGKYRLNVAIFQRGTGARIDANNPPFGKFEPQKAV